MAGTPLLAGYNRNGSGPKGLLGPKKAQLRGDQHGLLSLAAAEKLA